jgi:hypothetical protein
MCQAQYCLLRAFVPHGKRSISEMEKLRLPWLVPGLATRHVKLRPCSVFKTPAVTHEALLLFRKMAEKRDIMDLHEQWLTNCEVDRILKSDRSVAQGGTVTCLRSHSMSVGQTQVTGTG